MDHGGTVRHAPFRRIADELRVMITSGELPVGATLPSLTEISKAHQVSVSTAQKAVGLLRDEGLVATGNGVPTTVIAAEVTTATSSTDLAYEELSGRVDALTAEVARLEKLFIDYIATDSRNAGARSRRSRATGG